MSEEAKTEKKKPLVTLAEHNRAISAAHAEQCAPEKRGKPNGIACPMCKGELVDTNPGVILTSNPPQKNVHCPVCAWSGHRLC